MCLCVCNIWRQSQQGRRQGYTAQQIVDPDMMFVYAITNTELTIFVPFYKHINYILFTLKVNVNHIHMYIV